MVLWVVFSSVCVGSLAGVFWGTFVIGFIGFAGSFIGGFKCSYTVVSWAVMLDFLQKLCHLKYLLKMKILDIRWAHLAP